MDSITTRAFKPEYTTASSSEESSTVHCLALALVGGLPLTTVDVRLRRFGITAGAASAAPSPYLRFAFDFDFGFAFAFEL